MHIEIRTAVTADVPRIFRIRTSVTENALTMAQLAAVGITGESVAAMIAAAPCAWVALADGNHVGFAMIDIDEATVFAVFVLPGFEGKGIGAKLLASCETALFRRHQVIGLITSGKSRAAGFYRHLGWGNETDIGLGDIRLEKRRDQQADEKA